MLIDWFTVGAQIVNFLVLLWLLKKVLFGPIVRAIDERESRIAARVADAEAREKEACEQLSLYQAKLQDFEQAHEAMLAAARQEADRLHADLLNTARDQVHSLETKWQEDLERERETFLLELRERAAAEILAVARRVVADLAGADVQQCAVRTFLANLDAIGKDVRMNAANGELSVRSAVDLPEDSRAEIHRRVEGWLGRPVGLRFERAPGIGLGLEVRGDGWRLGWNLDAYMDALEERVKEALEQSSGSGRRAAKATA
jgi:F-type H+-transporting ATPase subunit b